MKLFRLISGPLKVNTYFLIDERSNDTVIIDCGESYNLIRDTAKQYGLNVKAVLLTHAHFDHAGGAKKLQDDGAKIYIGHRDAPKLLNEENLGYRFGRKFDYLTADVPLYDGDAVVISNITIRVMNTPGHTDGSVCYVVDNMIFSGDTLLFESVGRTDFPTGNGFALEKSVQRLFDLEGDFNVYPGHGEFTTLEHERKNNGFVDYV